MMFIYIIYIYICVCVCVCSIAISTREMGMHGCDWKFGIEGIEEGSGKKNVSPMYRGPFVLSVIGFKELQTSVLHTLMCDTKCPGIFQILNV
jgi:hypothetical protein